ncbi:MAG: hypothetical protein WBI26_06680, partial [Syntrophomonadaceae bacterium]
MKVSSSTGNKLSGKGKSDGCGVLKTKNYFAISKVKEGIVPFVNIQGTAKEVLYYARTASG